MMRMSSVVGAALFQNSALAESMLKATKLERDTARGTELLHELREVLATIEGFDEVQTKAFGGFLSAMIEGMPQRHWNEEEYKRDLIKQLKFLQAETKSSDASVACGAFIYYAFLETYYLMDEDAKLVNNLAGFQITRARLIEPSLSRSVAPGDARICYVHLLALARAAFGEFWRADGGKRGG
jgi:hypothetical protein